MDRLGQTRLNWLMDNEPERVLELYHNGRMLDLESQLASDLQQADQYIKDRVKEGMSELEAEDWAVELILAPKDGPEFSDNPPEPLSCCPRRFVLRRSCPCLKVVFSISRAQRRAGPSHPARSAGA